MADIIRQEQLETESIARSRPRRVVPPVQMYEHSNLLAYALNVEINLDEGEPQKFEEAMAGLSLFIKHF